MGWPIWPYAYGAQPARASRQIYSNSGIATAAAPDKIIVPIPYKGKITSVELDASYDDSTDEYFKYAEAYAQSPKDKGYLTRLVSGQLLPMRDARLLRNCDINVKDDSEVQAHFYGITTGTRIYVTVNIVEE